MKEAADYSPKLADASAAAAMASMTSGLSPIAGCSRIFRPGCAARTCSIEARQVLAQMAAAAEQERHDVDAGGAEGGQRAQRRRQVRRHQLEEGELDGPARRCSAQPLGHGPERLSPAWVARAVRDEDDRLRHR